MINFPNFILLLILILLLISYSLSLKFPMKTIDFKQLNHISNNLRYLNISNLQSYDKFYNLMTIPICIGIPRQCFNLLYDTGEMYLIVSNTGNMSKFKKAYNMSLSQTCKMISYYFNVLQYRKGIIHLREVSDFVFISENRPSYIFNFLLAWNTTIPYNFEGILGLGYLYNGGYIFDEKFSFIEYLKHNKQIKNKLFGHEYYNRTHGSFYIDEIPLLMNDSNYFKCKVEGFIPYLNKWHCDMNSISFSTGEIFLEIHSPVAFSTGYTEIRGPYVEGLILFNALMTYLDNKCEIIDYSNGDYVYSKMLCNNSISFYKIPDISFNLKGFKLNLLNVDLFKLYEIYGEKKYICTIIIDTRYNYWNLGEPILKNYNMVFDYEDKSVGFRESVNLIREDYFTIIVLICILLTVCSFGILIHRNRHRLFMQDFKVEILDHLKKTESFNEGKEMEKYSE